VEVGEEERVSMEGGRKGSGEVTPLSMTFKDKARATTKSKKGY